jgi:hypothetical protein
VPWCERCDRFLNPNTVLPDGTCPTCGRRVDPVAEPQDDTDHDAQGDTGQDDEGVRAPWHFWVMVGGVVLYLGWRLLQGIAWGVENWF